MDRRFSKLAGTPVGQAAFLRRLKKLKPAIQSWVRIVISTANLNRRLTGFFDELAAITDLKH